MKWVVFLARFCTVTVAQQSVEEDCYNLSQIVLNLVQNVF